jgi:type IV secretory pathway VirB3-like protein
MALSKPGKSHRGLHRPAVVLAVPFWLCVAVFSLNDFVFISVRGTYWVYITDYASRVAILLLVFRAWWGQRQSGISLASFLFLKTQGRHRTGAGWITLAWSAGATTYGLILESYLRPWLHRLLPNTQLFGFPNLTGIPRLLDLFLGIALVSLSEETFSRSLGFRVFSILTKAAATETRSAVDSRWRPLRVVFSWRLWLLLLLFGIGHWSNGIDVVIADTLIGAGFAASLVFTGSLWPGLIAHYVIDVAIFGGMI